MGKKSKAKAKTQAVKDGKISSKDVKSLFDAGYSKSKVDKLMKKHSGGDKAKSTFKSYSSSSSSGGGGGGGGGGGSSKNQTTAAIENDRYQNALTAEQQTRSDVDYIRQMTPEALNYQKQSEAITAKNTLNEISAQGAIVLDDRRIQADSANYIADRGVDRTRIEADASNYAADRSVDKSKLETDAQRYGYDQQLKGVGLETDAEKYGYDQQLKGVGLQTEAQKYGYDKQLQGTMYSSDKELEGIQYKADSDLSGIKYRADTDKDIAFGGYRSAEEQIRIKGRQDRKTLVQGTDETLRLRADARGQIRKASARFYS